MPQTFIVDQTQTFSGVAFLSSEPKIKFGSKTEQEMTSDGMPKWEIQLVAGFRDNFGKTQNEVIKVGVSASKDPAAGLPPYTPVQLKGFTVGVMEKTARDDRSKVVGFTVWYRCDEIKPLSAPPAGPGGKS